MSKRLTNATLLAALLAFSLASAAQEPTPDLILYNGKIFTSNAAHPYVQALAIRGDRIMATGDSAKIAALAGPKTGRIDLGGRTVIPGINDAHNHLGIGPANETDMEFKGFNPSWEEVKAKIVAAVARTPKGTFIRGEIGLSIFHDVTVNREALDKLAPEHPVILTSISGHAIRRSEMIVVTGASGRTGKRVAEVLLTRGQRVRAIGRDARRLAPLVNLGAEAAVGSVEDIPRLSTFFDGAEAVYLVLPEDLSQQDLRAHQEHISNCYVAAIRNAHVQFVVNLSSIGGQHPKGTGPIVGLHNQEQKLNRITDLNVLHLRAAYFMENLFASLEPLVAKGTLPGGMRGDIAIPWIATKDIGTYAAKRLEARDFAGSSIQELHGQRDISMNEAASIIGKAINSPSVTYVQLSNSVLTANLLGMGMPARTVDLILEMWEGANAGLIRAQEQRSVRNTTPTSLESFVIEVFAPAVRAASH